MIGSSPKRVLVVDDERDVLEFVSLVLEDGGYQVLHAGDGLEALDQIECGGPDLVVLDLMIPRLDGWGVLSRLRRMAAAPPVVVLSAFADRTRALEAGAADCLSKPFMPADLVGACRRALAA